MESGEIDYLRPDAKSQVTIEYDGDQPARISAVVLSTQHAPDVSYDQIRKDIIEQVIRPTLPASCSTTTRSSTSTRPAASWWAGRWATPVSPGRKIIVDTYGGMGRHGGGAFSGKDPSKVDRSAAYAARWVAKNLVKPPASPSRCEVQLAYAIGVAEPVSIRVDTFGTGDADRVELERLVRKHFDLTPSGIIDALGLRAPIYRPTSYHGHFGREGFPWESTDKADAIRKDA